MSEQQPNALRLAGALEAVNMHNAGSTLALCIVKSSATELRRLHELNAELLEALQTVVANSPDPYCAITRAIDAQCRAAIAKATGE